jgi:hypothetical protein
LAPDLAAKPPFDDFVDVLGLGLGLELKLELGVGLVLGFEVTAVGAELVWVLELALVDVVGVGTVLGPVVVAAVAVAAVAAPVICPGP